MRATFGTWLVGLLALPGLAWAAPPLAVQGILRSAAGGPVPDGDYALAVRLYEKADDVQPLVLDVATTKVQGGLFAYTLGSLLPMSQVTIASGQAAWVGVQVGNEPELPRVALSAVPYAVRAQVAANLACTGCVGLGQIDPAVLASFVKSSMLAGVATSGSYADLNGVPTLPKLQACPPGQALTGFAANGNPTCAALPTYSNKDFVPVNQGCKPGQLVQGFAADGSVVCTATAAKLSIGPMAVDAGKSLLLEHNLGTLDVVAQAWSQGSDGAWYPIEASLNVASPPVNVAAQANGGKCIDQSSNYSGGGPDGGYGCNKALDGNYADAENASWATFNQGVGAFFVVQFDKAYTIDKMVVVQRSCGCEWNKQVHLEFSDGSKQTVPLPQSQGPHSIALQAVTTSSVKFVIDATYGSLNNGADEVEFWSTAASSQLKLRKTPNSVEVQNLTGKLQNLQLVVRP